ncbi:hypothetical protein PsAD46_04291 [Pseudovibrio sp. Ad46]|nr:hypothetical protein PsAD46_04291 [Pseudovibrio sp. Ad46]KZK98269.1 hypothetical protein PsAD5_01639 [Pseudovibrio sp. Ad5]
MAVRSKTEMMADRAENMRVLFRLLHRQESVFAGGGTKCALMRVSVYSPSLKKAEW